LRCSVLTTLLAFAIRPVSAQVRTLPQGLPFHVRSVQAVGKEAELGLVISAAVGYDGTVFLIDRSTDEVLHFAFSGRLLWRTGRKGQGPGEYQLPYRVVPRASGDVLVYDLALDRITVLDRQGRYVRTARFDMPFQTVDNIVALPSGGFAVCGVAQDLRARGLAVHIFDDSLRHLRSFGPLPPTRSQATLANWGAGSLSLTSDGDLLFVRRLPYEIYRFTPEGELKSVIRAPFDWRHTADDVMGTSLDGSRVVTKLNPDLDTPMLAIEIAHQMVLGGHGHRGAEYWDFFDAKGELIKTIRLPNVWKSVIGYDSHRATRWLVGESDLEPVLLRLTLAAE
jgi:6-bladed beta-propeller